MLILSRRMGEAIYINDDIKVILLGVKGNQTRIGIEAPENYSVHREEIYERIQKENEGNIGLAISGKNRFEVPNSMPRGHSQMNDAKKKQFYHSRKNCNF